MPIPIIEHSGRSIRCAFVRGPAVLVSRDCALDKKSALRVQFAPARIVADEDKHRQALILRDDTSAFEPFHLGVARDGVDYFFNIGESYWLPIDCLGWPIKEFPQFEEHETNRRCCLPTDERLGWLSPSEAELLRAKMYAFWTGEIPEGSRVSLDDTIPRSSKSAG